MFTNLLKRAGITKAELGRRIGIKPGTISGWGEHPPQYATAYLELLIRHNRLLP